MVATPLAKNESWERGKELQCTLPLPPRKGADKYSPSFRKETHSTYGSCNSLAWQSHFLRSSKDYFAIRVSFCPPPYPYLEMNWILISCCNWAMFLANSHSFLFSLNCCIIFVNCNQKLRSFSVR